jgi:hypothetical protein
LCDPSQNLPFARGETQLIFPSARNHEVASLAHSSFSQYVKLRTKSLCLLSLFW